MKIDIYQIIKRDDCQITFMKHIFFILIISLGLLNCKNKIKKQLEVPIDNTFIDLKYAEGFSVKDLGTHKILEIINPWPETEKQYRYVLIDKEHAIKTTFSKNEYDEYDIDEDKKIVNSMLLKAGEIKKEFDVEMPILETVYNILYNRKNSKKELKNLTNQLD